MRQTPLTDHELLDILDRFYRQGQTGKAIGEVYGRSRNAILGAINRVRTDDRAVEDVATKPENRDAGMPPRWWERQP